MLRIECPHCGLRDQDEFQYGGEAHIARPQDPDLTGDAEWGDYLFYRHNTRGPHRERWLHSYGCRRWFNVLRDTVTHEITEIYPMGTTPHLDSDSGDPSP